MKNTHPVTTFNATTQYNQLRTVHNLVHAIAACPGIIKLGATVIKTRGAHIYINQQIITQFISRHHGEHPHKRFSITGEAPGLSINGPPT
ncbi:MAG: hypothetical protein ABI921_00510 [Panacibacter sp.]